MFNDIHLSIHCFPPFAWKALTCAVFVCCCRHTSIQCSTDVHTQDSSFLHCVQNVPYNLSSWQQECGIKGVMDQASNSMRFKKIQSAFLLQLTVGFCGVTNLVCNSELKVVSVELYHTHKWIFSIQLYLYWTGLWTVKHNSGQLLRIFEWTLNHIVGSANLNDGSIHSVPFLYTNSILC